MRCFIVFLSVVLQSALTNGAVNYCGARMCGHSNAHTYCKYRPGSGPSCAGYMEAQLSAEEKTRVLARLNRRRSEMALGSRHWPPAGDMLKLRWIEELSREAQRWADQCRPPQSPEERDVCRDLYSISVGQCVASIVGEAPGLRPESMVDMWFMQSMLYHGNVTSYIPSRNNNYYGDFAQMMWSRTYLVGCGRSRFMVHTLNNDLATLNDYGTKPSIKSDWLSTVVAPIVIRNWYPAKGYIKKTHLFIKAEWRGRLRSVERLVCNFAPRGPVPARPLWTPADAASICPSRSYRDKLPGLCSYQSDDNKSRNFNDSWSAQHKYLLETVFEIEKNQSLDYLGSLDELYLTKIAIATIGTPMPIIPLYYSLQKRDVLDHNEGDDELLKQDDESEVVSNNMSTHHLISILSTKPKPLKTKVRIIGRPKPYDINELNDDTREQKCKNINDIQELKKNQEKDFYTDYGLLETEEDNIGNTTTAAVGVLVQPIHNDNTTEAILENNRFIEVINTTDGMVRSQNSFTSGNEEVNGGFINNKSMDDYLSDPETVRALQDALEQMERTLASPRPVSTSGKVRRELRNLEADVQNAASTDISEVATGASEVKMYQSLKEEERNKSKDRGPMLSMVLKYMPYLKPYENTIVGDTNSYGDAVRYDISVLICGFLLHDFVL